MKRLIEDGAIGKPLAVAALRCNPLQSPRETLFAGECVWRMAAEAR